MGDAAAFLQWALPRLGLAWSGFRRVRRQVSRRVGRRAAELGLPGLAAYRAYLEAHPEEWTRLDGFCRIPISRFWRDAPVFEALADEVLPALAQDAHGRGQVRAWSAGCASGEEPYSLSLLWAFRLSPDFPALRFEVVATDADAALLARAQAACYRSGSLKELPKAWRETAFAVQDGLRCLKPEYKAGVEFVLQDVRRATAAGPFDLVLCRNLAFTYFDAEGQREALRRLLAALRDGGALVIGGKERLPEGAFPVASWRPELRIYRKT
jgi:chemotaxis protein methyltransferase CheR